MKLVVSPQIENNRYNVLIKFSEFGSKKMTPEMEEKIINDYAPKFKLSDITFEGKYKVDATTNKIVEDSSAGETVTLATPNREIAINDALEIGYTVHVKEIADSEIGTELSDAYIVAQAKCQLFIDAVSAKVDEILLDLGAKFNAFEESYEIELG